MNMKTSVGGRQPDSPSKPQFQNFRKENQPKMEANKKRKPPRKSLLRKKGTRWGGEEVRRWEGAQEYRNIWKDLFVWFNFHCHPLGNKDYNNNVTQDDTRMCLGAWWFLTLIIIINIINISINIIIIIASIVNIISNMIMIAMSNNIIIVVWGSWRSWATVTILLLASPPVAVVSLWSRCGVAVEWLLHTSGSSLCKKSCLLFSSSSSSCSSGSWGCWRLLK